MSARYTLLYNPNTGKSFLIDRYKVRYNHMRRRVRHWVDVMGPMLGNNKLTMITLTYRPEQSWQAGDVRRFMVALRALLGDDLLAYAWVAELQARGAVHYHILLVVPPGVYVDKYWVLDTWGLGRTRTERARSVWYIITYLGKAYQKVFERFPKGARCFAVWLASDQMVEQLRFVSLPEAAQVLITTYGRVDGLKRYRLLVSGWRLYGFFDDKGLADCYQEKLDALPVGSDVVQFDPLQGA